MSKNHDCIAELRKQMMQADERLKWVRFDLSTIVDADARNPEYKTGQRIEYGYVHTKKDGSKVEKQEKSFITHKYCPFCGKKYE